VDNDPHSSDDMISSFDQQVRQQKLQDKQLEKEQPALDHNADLERKAADNNVEKNEGRDEKAKASQDEQRKEAEEPTSREQQRKKQIEELTRLFKEGVIDADEYVKLRPKAS